MGLRIGGRAKGTPNKVTADVRQIILEAVDQLGGHQRLIAWAKEDPANERIFWGQIMPKILPKELNVGGQADNPLNIGIRVTFVEPTRPKTADA